jgi:DNA-binding NarL/FixJ family response regulator
MRLVAAVGTADELLHVVDRELPDVVVTDIRMPPDHRMEGVELAIRIRLERPEIGVVVLSQHNDPDYAMALFRDGTKGLAYLLKQRVGEPATLVHAVTAVSNGGSIVDPEVVESLIARSSRSPATPMASLTERERNVLSLMAEGRTNNSIADQLCLSTSSIEKYISSIFAKLGLNDESELHRRVAAVLTFLQDQRRARPL